jgi:hypothetical protein
MLPAVVLAIALSSLRDLMARSMRRLRGVVVARKRSDVYQSGTRRMRYPGVSAIHDESRWLLQNHGGIHPDEEIAK